MTKDMTDYKLLETYDSIKDITLSEMYRQGYKAGYDNAWGEAQLEMKRLRDCLHAILSKGEAPRARHER